jgi:signal transduction histidine kinase
MNERINFLKFFYDSGKYGDDSVASQIVDMFPAVIFAYDVEARKIGFANKRFSNFFGFNTYDLRDQENLLQGLFHQGDWARVKGEVEKFVSANEDDSLTLCCRLRSRQGFATFHEITVSILKRANAGKAASLLFVCQDITIDVKQNGQTKSVKKLFDEAEELLQFGSWTLFVDQQIMEWTPGLSLMLDYGKTPQIRTQRHFIEHLMDEDRKVFKECVMKTLNEKQDFSCELSVKTKNGVAKKFFTHGRAVINAHGVVDHIVGITSDITKLRKFEREQELAIRELNRSNQELEEFAYVASHDMQEPLRKITMFAERLQKKLEGKLDEDSQLYLNRIAGSAVNMKSLIDHLLEFSRTNRRSESFDKCNISDVMIHVLSDLELKVEESKAHVELDGTLPTIEGSKAELTQLFSNLLSNAIKFRHTGQDPVVKLSVRKLSREEKIQRRLSVERNYFQFEVADNGIGFEPEYAERIFVIFQRLNGKSEYPGSGIGLAICKKIVDNHQGLISATSQPGLGATFTIILPEKQL